MKTLKTLLLCGGLAVEALLAADEAPTAANSVARLSRQSESLSTGAASEKAWVKSTNIATNSLRLNFSGAPLSAVLDYFSRAAGLIIVQETPVEGTVEVLNPTPVSLEEAVSVLNASLAVKRVAALRQGRALFIVKRDEAKTRDIPVRRGNDPEAVPRTAEMVTQVIPVRYADATQMTRDLQPLLPAYTSLTANESGNALVLTATQADVRRLLQIVRALDTTISSLSTIRILPLQNADAKELAGVIKELFPAPDTSTQNNAVGANNAPPMAFAGGPAGMDVGGFPGFGPGGPFADATGSGGGQTTNRSASGTGRSEARQAAYRVTVVADERTHALVVSAPEDLLKMIEQLVKEIVTELDANPARKQKVFVYALENANSPSVQQVLRDMFQSQNSGSDNSQPGTDPLLARQTQASQSSTQFTFGNSAGNNTGARQNSGGNLP